jgi:hypothetical protein
MEEDTASDLSSDLDDLLSEAGWQDASEDFDNLDDLLRDQRLHESQPGEDTPGTAASYIKRKGEAIMEGMVVITVIQVVYMFLLLKQQSNMTDTAFDMMCRAIHELLFPAGNLFPPSWYLMKRIAGVDSLDQHEYHICPDCELHIYAQVPRSGWKAHRDDTCPVCASSQHHSPRFKRTTKGTRELLEPRQVCVIALQLLCFSCGRRCQQGITRSMQAVQCRGLQRCK